MRARHPEPRPLHLLLHPLPRPDRGAHMTGRVVVIGVGNPFRRDDGVGPAVVEALRDHVPDGTVLAVSDGEPSRMLDLWHGADTVVVVEAVRTHPAWPGRLHTLSAAEAAAQATGP